MAEQTPEVDIDSVIDRLLEGEEVFFNDTMQGYSGCMQRAHAGLCMALPSCFIAAITGPQKRASIHPE